MSRKKRSTPFEITFFLFFPAFEAINCILYKFKDIKFNPVRIKPVGIMQNKSVTLRRGPDVVTGATGVGIRIRRWPLIVGRWPKEAMMAGPLTLKLRRASRRLKETMAEGSDGGWPQKWPVT
jgi:hypothetical protein